MNRGEYLKKIIEEKGYNIMSLSRESGVPYTTIRSMIERDLTNASIDNVIKICRVLGISVEALSKAGMVPEKVDSNIKPAISLPLYGSIAAGALSTVEPVIKNNVEYIPIPRNMLGKYASCKNLFALKVNGESMNKVIPNGSYVVCKPIEIEELKEDDIVIFSHDNEYSMKRFRRDEENRLLIFSPESTDRKYHDIVIPYDTTNDLKVYAKVIWYAVTLD
ncbi:helix-turn-helix domain-containing protein [Parageobacillus thermoglucosidasius]|uniref:XRE family transcriptional regulator n=1 Tax=Parageobacillus thermoglucosidasius TaxID=1426 RepID=A0A1B7KWS4_PARTM|nr:XRE family transcriptional regulator [Parageobacillus thermoglucosidasius]OAT74526.1 XRE family transcriptional regulator [Parageobacillus thermoglucosidasius]